MDDEPALLQMRAGLVDAAQDALEQVACGVLSALVLHHRPRCLVERDEIREGAADVHADPQGHWTRSIWPQRAGPQRRDAR